MKVGVLVVAYNAETTLARVLDRIPPATKLQLAEVLVQDDHSQDDTHSVALEYLAQQSHLNLTAVRHPENLGYGGNQKAGYTYAINHGWDVVVLLHGDGQYAPEIIGDIIAPIVEGGADAVFGSRMMVRGRRGCVRRVDGFRAPRPGAAPNRAKPSSVEAATTNEFGGRSRLDGALACSAICA